MKITRDGKEYELTKEELIEAYYEQKHNWDVESVLTHSQEWEQYLPNGAAIEDYAEKIAYETRRNIDEYDMQWYCAYREAMCDILNVEYM